MENLYKAVVTRWQILKVKYTKFVVGWGPSQTSLRELTALPQAPWLDLRGPTSKGREGKAGKTLAMGLPAFPEGCDRSVTDGQTDTHPQLRHSAR